MTYHLVFFPFVEAAQLTIEIRIDVMMFVCKQNHILKDKKWFMNNFFYKLPILHGLRVSI